MTATEPDRSALDSSVVVAGLLPWHVDHVAARAALRRVVVEGGPDRAVLPVPALVESYSVLTRLPPAHRLDPTAAFQLLTEAFAGRVTMASIDAVDAWPFLGSLRDGRVAGGAVYDALILAAAVGAGARRLFTFNHRQFRRLAPEEIEIAVPAPPGTR